MSEFRLPQALLAIQGSHECRWLGHTPEFEDAWREQVASLCLGFGPRPPGVRCTEALFVQPLGKRLIAVCSVADLGTDDAGEPYALGFRVIVLSRMQYQQLDGDPFLLVGACPPPWHARGDLPPAVCPVPAPRTVETVCEVLKRTDGPVLLGATQALVDGCKVAWRRQQPDTELLRSLWTLLPATTRWHLMPASFAFHNNLRFDAVVVPKVRESDFDHQYLSEEQAENYPEGSYELGVQVAAEAGDQRSLEQMFARKSRREIWRVGLWLLGSLIVLTVATHLIKLWIR